MTSKLAIGTWLIGEDLKKRALEIDSINYALNNNLNIIDTAEMYGDGLSESLIGKIISKRKREDIYLVSKVYPSNATKEGIRTSLLNSLKRLNTKYLDLYLLHWLEPNVRLDIVVETFETLKKEGYIKNWGVSNFDVKDLEKLYEIKDGKNCYANQVLYNITSRGIEYDLIPFAKDNHLKLMYYSVLGHSDFYRQEVIYNKNIINIAKKHKISPYGVMLLFTLRQEGISLIKASIIEHMKELISVSDKKLDCEDLKIIDEIFLAPKNKVELEMI